MKRLVLKNIPALICGVVFIGCNSEMAEKTDFITSDDIISFNVNSGEIVFTNAVINGILSHIDHYLELQLFIGHKPVFNPPLPVGYFKGDAFCCSPCPWAGMNDLGLFVFTKSSGFLLIEGYLPWHFLSNNENDREAILKKQEENSKKRKKELEILVEHLRKAGKIIE